MKRVAGLSGVPSHPQRRAHPRGDCCLGQRISSHQDKTQTRPFPFPTPPAAAPSIPLECGSSQSRIPEPATRHSSGCFSLPPPAPPLPLPPPTVCMLTGACTILTHKNQTYRHSYTHPTSLHGHSCILMAHVHTLTDPSPDSTCFLLAVLVALPGPLTPSPDPGSPPPRCQNFLCAASLRHEANVPRV